MYIIDCNGKRIEVTDLEAAISQATAFTAYRHEDESYKRLDETLNEYWQDIQAKLTELRENINSSKR